MTPLPQVDSNYEDDFENDAGDSDGGDEGDSSDGDFDDDSSYETGGNGDGADAVAVFPHQLSTRTHNAFGHSTATKSMTSAARSDISNPTKSSTNATRGTATAVVSQAAQSCHLMATTHGLGGSQTAASPLAPLSPPGLWQDEIGSTAECEEQFDHADNSGSSSTSPPKVVKFERQHRPSPLQKDPVSFKESEQEATYYEDQSSAAMTPAAHVALGMADSEVRAGTSASSAHRLAGLQESHRYAHGEATWASIELETVTHELGSDIGVPRRAVGKEIELDAAKRILTDLYRCRSRLQVVPAF
jgi:hypothetical protein